MKSKIIFGCWLAVPFAVAVACLGISVCGSEPADTGSAAATLEGREAELKAAEDAYKQYYVEWNSLEMARSATREIAVSARATAEKDLEEMLAARQTCKEKAEACKAAQQAAQAASTPEQKKECEEALAHARTELDEAKERLAQKVDTVRQSGNQMIRDQQIANERIEGLIVSEEKMGELLAAIWAAKRNVLVLKAQAAEQAAQQAREAGAAESSKLADEAEAARRAICENDYLAAWEKQLWMRVTLHDQTLATAHSHSADAARIAERIAQAESDPESKATFERFAAEQRRYEAENKDRLAQLNQRIEAAGQGTYPLRARAMGGLEPLAPDAWDYAKARHLLVRAGFGGTPQEVQKLCEMGLYAAVDYLVDYYRQPAASAPLDATPVVPADPLAAKLVNDWTRGRGAQPQGAVDLGRVRRWWLERMVQSPRPLQEKLALFWHGHFSTQYSVVGNSYTTYRQNQLFREHAAGNFGALVYGIVHDPVMLRYLDNNTNVKGHPNENLAREIMELFSMGAYQGYTEVDVREAARALTGYTFDDRAGQFRFVGKNHDEQPKTIFGREGNWTGDDVVQLILEQPSTSRFVARKLFEYFAYDEPSSDTLERLANVLRHYNYELAPMLKNLFLSQEFYSDRAMGTQIKCPVQLVIGMLRDVGSPQGIDYGRVDALLREMGQELFEPPDVKGWRYGRPWISSERIFSRYNGVAQLISDGRDLDIVAFVEQGGCEKTADVVDYLARACLILPLSSQKQQELIEYLGELPPRSEWSQRRDELNQRLKSVLILITSMPEYQMT